MKTKKNQLKNNNTINGYVYVEKKSNFIYGI